MGGAAIRPREVEFELWTRLNARGLAPSHGDAARMLLARVAFVELERPVLSRALQPFPMPVRTLDVLHLASAGFLREQGVELSLATYDQRMSAGAEAMGLPLYPI